MSMLFLCYCAQTDINVVVILTLILFSGKVIEMFLAFARSARVVRTMQEP